MSEKVMWYGLFLFLFCMFQCTVSILRDTNTEFEQEQAEWNRFSTEHHCHVVSRTNAAYREHARTGYLCDDGITYLRAD